MPIAQYRSSWRSVCTFPSLNVTNALIYCGVTQSPSLDQPDGAGALRTNTPHMAGAHNSIEMKVHLAPEMPSPPQTHTIQDSNDNTQGRPSHRVKPAPMQPALLCGVENGAQAFKGDPMLASFCVHNCIYKCVTGYKNTPSSHCVPEEDAKQMAALTLCRLVRRPEYKATTAPLE